MDVAVQRSEPPGAVKMIAVIVNAVIAAADPIVAGDVEAVLLLGGTQGNRDKVH